MTRSFLARGAVLLVLAGTLTGASAQTGSTVVTGGYFYRYSGPVGSPIYGDGSTAAPDASPYQSHFAGQGFDVVVAPTVRYTGYEEEPLFSNTGTTTFDLPQVSSTLAFWNQVTPDFAEARNFLSITGATTTDVSLDPVTQQSPLIRLATFTFTNGDWFSASPDYNPGYGPLYGESSFAFSLVIQPTPFIGPPTGFPGYDVWNDTLVLASTRGAGTPDLFYFAGSSQLGGLLVDEGATGSVEIWGRIGVLEIVEFRNASAGVTILAVPEPGSVAMMLAGLGLLGWIVQRRRVGA